MILKLKRRVPSLSQLEWFCVMFRIIHLFLAFPRGALNLVDVETERRSYAQNTRMYKVQTSNHSRTMHEAKQTLKNALPSRKLEPVYLCGKQ